MSESNVATATPDPDDSKNEIQKIARPGPLVGKTFSLVPKDLKEAMEYAKMIAGSDLVPKDYKGKEGNCLIGMQFGAELGLPALQALQNIAVINGKPGIYGDLGKALLLSKGFVIEERDIPEIKKTGIAWCRVTRPNKGQSVERTFSLEDAKTAKLWGKEGPWTTYPYRMMAWRAFWWAARDAAADVLKGIGGVEELMDYRAEAIDTTAEVNTPKEIEDKPAAEPTPNNPAVDATPKPPENGLTPDQRKNIVALMAKNKVTADQLKKYLFDVFGIIDLQKPTAFVTQQQYPQVCKWIEAPQEEIPFGV